MGYLSKIIAVLSLSLLFSLVVGNKVRAADPATPTAPPAGSCDLSTVKDDNGNTIKNNSWFLPDCAYFEGTEKQQTCGCRNINVFVELMINVANKILMMVGGVALLVFIYGGFLILTAAGGDNVKKGKETLVAAVIGLIIIFSAQLLLNFVLTTIIKAGGKAGVSVQGTQVIVPAETK